MSTKSTLYNHPTRIVEAKKFKLDKRGMPANVLQDHALQRGAAKAAAAIPEEGAAKGDGDEDDDEDDDEDEDEDDDRPRANKGVARARDETPEQRKARKQVGRRGA